jgi:hypothetical protein
MMTTLADIRSKPSTPARQAAITNLETGLARMAEHALRTPRGGGRQRTMTIHDRERLMGMVDDPNRTQGERDRAMSILDGNGDITKGDARFLDRVDGNNRKGDHHE